LLDNKKNRLKDGEGVLEPVKYYARIKPSTGENL